MKKATLAFYNTENFFDPAAPFRSKAKDFAPRGKKRWTQNKYRNKVSKIAEVLSEIGRKETREPPMIIGLAEVENSRVLTDLIRSPYLSPFGYDFVHYTSPDERGMDTAMLYRKEEVRLISSKPLSGTLDCMDGSREVTRDILYAQVEAMEQEFHLFFLHLPSRKKSVRVKDFRARILESLSREIETILEENAEALIILAGDFNCNPDDEELQKILRVGHDEEGGEYRFYNPFLNFPEERGTSKYHGRWHLFDQVLCSKSLMKTDGRTPFLDSAEIFSPQKLRQPHPNGEGAPLRTYAGRKYLGGYSDHFPVYAILNH